MKIRLDKQSTMSMTGIGQEINVNYNLRGRKWTSPQGETRYFTTLDVWKIEKIGEPTNQPNF